MIPQRPVRTCIGCRQRVAAAELLRVVVAPSMIGKAHEPRSLEARQPSDTLGGGPVALPVVPDPRRRAEGRGAWLHPDQRCVELAIRRRAFARALRVPGPLDPAPVCEYVAGAGLGAGAQAVSTQAGSTQPSSAESAPPTSGTPQETKS